MIFILEKWHVHFVARPSEVGKDEEMCPEVQRLVVPLENAEDTLSGSNAGWTVRR